MDVVALFALFGYAAHRQEQRVLNASRVCLYCPQLVHWNGRIWVHPDGAQYVSVPSRVRGVVPSVHPAIPDRSLMGTP